MDRAFERERIRVADTAVRWQAKGEPRDAYRIGFEPFADIAAGHVALHVRTQGEQDFRWAVFANAVDKLLDPQLGTACHARR